MPVKFPICVAVLRFAPYIFHNGRFVIVSSMHFIHITDIIKFCYCPCTVARQLVAAVA